MKSARLEEKIIAAYHPESTSILYKRKDGGRLPSRGKYY